MYEPTLGDAAGTALPKHYPARPVVKVAIGYMAGLVAGWTFPVNVTLITSLLLLTLAIILLLALRRAPQARQVIWGCSVTAAILVGLIRAELVTARQRSIDNQVSYLARISPVDLYGRVATPPTPAGERIRVLLTDVTAARWGRTYNLPGSVELRFPTEHPADVAVGSRLRARADISTLRGALLPGGFSPREFYYARSQVARAYADEKDVAFIAPVRRKHGWDSIKQAVWAFGNEGFRFVREVFPPREAGLLAALTFGVRTEMPWEVENAFQRSGLAHITVVSGLHLTLLLSGLLWLLKLLRFRRRVALMIALPLIGLFLLLVGPRVPTLRAAAMAVLLMLGVFLDRPVDRLNVLALAALLILLPWPDELRQVSFQLSFLAVLSLVVVVPAVSQILRLPTRIPWSYFTQLLTASFVVSTAIAPLTIYHFHLWCPVVLVGNFVAIPLLTVLLPVTYLFLFFHHFGLDVVSNLLGPLVHSLAGWLLGVAESLASWPWGHVELTRADIGVLSAASLILLFISTPRVRPSARAGRPWRPILVCLALVVVGVWYDAASAVGRPLRADFLALGQGDATFIRTSEGATILVDGGAPPRYGEPGRTVSLVEYLLNQGVDRINLLVLTHPQVDHIGALPYVLARFPVDLVLDCGLDADIDLWREYRQGVIRSGARWEIVRAGDRIAGLGDLKVEVLHPRGSRGRHPAARDTNEHSVVLLLSWRDLQIVLTGDIGFPSEESLFASRPKAKAVILKVPHHGSRFASSWEFIEDVAPTIAVAEVGRNPYGHPHERTIRRYYGMGVQFFRTDWHGSIRVLSDGSDVRVVTTRRGAVYEYRPEQEGIESSVREDADL